MSLLLMLAGTFISFYGIAMDSLGLSALGIAVMALAIFFLRRSR
jgi:hypothetical protein